MGKYAKASTQANSVIKDLQRLSETQRETNEKMALPSLGTARDYGTCLKHVADWMKTEQNQSLRDLTKDLAVAYLSMRAEEVGQKTLDQERQAIQAMMQSVTHQLQPTERLDVIKSEHLQVLTSRAYTEEQMHAIANSQSDKYSLATEIAYAAGLRAHELLTIAPLHEREPDKRPISEFKFKGRPEGSLYTVQGKGGLIRVISIPKELAARLESKKLEIPRAVCDRDIYYKQLYDIAGGKSWSTIFSKDSSRVLSFSTGAHGLRHSYAQDRMEELRKFGCNRLQALETVSQELGHFRPEITETYLR